MTVRFYILPVQRVTVNGQVSRGPMYIRWGAGPTGWLNPDGLQNVQWSMKDYGSIDLAGMAVETITADHTWLAAQANVYQFPENIDVTMTAGQRSTLSAYLEAHGVPGTWLAPGDTFRSGLRTVTGMFLYMQRLTAMTGNVSPLDWGYTLNTQWKNMSTAHQQAVTEAAVSLDYSTAFIGANTQVRAILKGFSDQWGVAPILFGFVTL